MYSAPEHETLYNVRKFPDLDKDSWIAENQELVDAQMAKFEGLFEEPVKRSFQDIIAQYVFLENTLQEIAEWKENLARFLSYTMTVDEGHLKERDSSKDFHGGRLSLLKELLEWF